MHHAVGRIPVTFFFQRHLRRVTVAEIFVDCLFYPFLGEPAVRLYGVEAAGEGLEARHAATLTCGRPGVLHGAMSLLQDSEGQVQEAVLGLPPLDQQVGVAAHAFEERAGALAGRSARAAVTQSSSQAL